MPSIFPLSHLARTFMKGRNESDGSSAAVPSVGVLWRALGPSSAARCSLLVTSCAALLFLLVACARTATPVDWATLEAEGRVVTEPLGLGVQDVRWTDGSLELELAPVKGPFSHGVRLVTWVSGAEGNRTRFILDTGTTGSLLAGNAPLAREVFVSRMPFRTVGTHAQGYMGHLPVARMGPLVGRDLSVGVVTGSRARGSERNVLGIVQLFHTQWERRDGRWTLRSGAAQRAPSEEGWAVVRLERGVPVLRVEGPDGHPLYALLDTGAFQSFAVGSGTTGTYRLRTSDDSQEEVHAVVVRRKEDSVVDPRFFGGYEIGVVLGMDVLTTRDWRLTFDQATWAFPPRGH